MKFVALLFCCLMSCDCAHNDIVDVRYTDINPNKMLEKIKPLTWVLIADYGNGLSTRCLGTPVYIENLGVVLLTAEHCVDPVPLRIYAKPITAENSKYAYFKIYKTTKAIDLALLYPIGKIEKTPTSTLAYLAPRHLDPYYQLKFNKNGDGLIFYRGHLLDTETQYTNATGSRRLSGLSAKGNSGGPIFNLRGHLICILTHTTNCTQWHSLLRWANVIQKQVDGKK